MLSHLDKNKLNVLMRSGLFSVVCSLSFGCSSAPKTSEETSLRRVLQQNSDANPTGSSSSSSSANGKMGSGSSRMVEYSDLRVQGQDLTALEYDFPIVINDSVEQWVKYFTGRGRKHFERYLARSEYFIPYIEPILKHYQVPTDLVYLAMIESGFHNHARSLARAVGPWQFIPATGRRYGLTVNWWMDERRDIEKSSVAAILYLRELYQRFGTWELAAASYNAGEGKIDRAIQMYGTRDFWQLSSKKRRYLKPETKNYVPKIMAAALVAKNRELFGFPARYTPVVEVQIPKSAQTPLLPARAGAKLSDEEVLAALETANKGVENADESTEDGEELPPSKWETVNDAEDDEELATENIVAGIPHVNKNGELGYTELVEFEVAGPIDLMKVAEASGLDYSTVRALNPAFSRWVTPPDIKSVKIRLPKAARSDFLDNKERVGLRTDFYKYKSRVSESLKRLALRFKLREDPLRDLNPKVSSVRKGQLVVLPLPNDSRATALASLDVIDPPERSRRRRRTRRRRNIAQSKRLHKAQAPTIRERRSQRTVIRARI